MAQDRGLKNRIQVSSTLKKENHEWLQKESKKTDIPISKILDRAIETYKKDLLK